MQCLRSGGFHIQRGSMLAKSRDPERDGEGGGGYTSFLSYLTFFYYFTFNKKHIIIHDWQDVKLLSIEASRDDPSTITINSVIDMHYDKNSSSILGVVCTFCWVWLLKRDYTIIHWPSISEFCNGCPNRKWNESGFRPPLCTYRLNWARRTSWGWWDDWDDTVLQTQDSKFEPWRSEAEHATSRSRRLPTILTFTRGWGRKQFCLFQTAETGNRTPDSGMRGSGANHYPRAPALPNRRNKPPKKLHKLGTCFIQFFVECISGILCLDNLRWCECRSFSLVGMPNSGGYKGRGGLGGWNTPLPLRKTSTPYLEVSLWFGDILSERQCPICLRLHDKTFGNQKFPRGRVPLPLYSKIFVLPNFNPPPPTEKLDPPLPDSERVFMVWCINTLLECTCWY